MATEKQREAARRNIRKAQAAKKASSDGQHARAQPEGRKRKKPGTGGEGDYYHVELSPKGDYMTLRTQDVGAGEREQLVQLVSDALGVVARAFGNGAEA